ncbi:MAG: hypothetical protein QF766_03260 [Candidatus Poseidoniia archaeon]|jgi:hypothetical protein|nr:hypothetical protein [Candidatus Poseidoniia archaeon]MDP7243049.1 hypothetical protein [Candidatus Poseidoniia archaeon]MDP7535782.1 hypothetical protein [Candidatus Poseidoniia archaeon]MDP7607204.1 hypothetical protein [Candidatus Poseidoniia archaeon]HJP44151.1 hypothetical protein [Candidatus Poseidoniia archaeon]
MALSDTVGEKLKQFERYNNSELRRMELPGGFPFAVTGRLVSGTIGFAIIIIILAISFQSAANSVAVSGIGGGSTGFEANVATNTTAGPGKSGTLNSEGTTVQFGVDASESEWDFTGKMQLVEVVVELSWSAQGGDFGQPTVSLQITAGNFSESTEGEGFDVTISITIPVTALENNQIVSGSANSADEFIASFEAAGPAVSGVITYEDDANPMPLNEPLDYTLTCTLVNWELQKIHEVSDI